MYFAIWVRYSLLFHTPCNFGCIFNKKLKLCYNYCGHLLPKCSVFDYRSAAMRPKHCVRMKTSAFKQFDFESLKEKMNRYLNWWVKHHAMLVFSETKFEQEFSNYISDCAITIKSFGVYFTVDNKFVWYLLSKNMKL